MAVEFLAAPRLATRPYVARMLAPEITLLSLKKAVSKLKEREKKVIYSRYVIGKTQTELSAELNISQAQVSRIEKTALENIKRLVK